MPKTRNTKHKRRLSNTKATVRIPARRAVSPASRTVRKRSKMELAGLPLWEVARGPDHDRGERHGHARAWFAVGDVADGVVAIGGIARGIVSVGGLAAGVVALGGISAGLVAALGGVALAPYAMGGLAAGAVARGGVFASVATGGRLRRAVPQWRRVFCDTQDPS